MKRKSVRLKSSSCFFTHINSNTPLGLPIGTAAAQKPRKKSAISCFRKPLNLCRPLKTHKSPLLGKGQRGRLDPLSLFSLQLKVKLAQARTIHDCHGLPLSSSEHEQPSEPSGG